MAQSFEKWRENAVFSLHQTQAENVKQTREEFLKDQYHSLSEKLTMEAVVKQQEILSILSETPEGAELALGLVRYGWPGVENAVYTLYSHYCEYCHTNVIEPGVYYPEPCENCERLLLITGRLSQTVYRQ